MTQQGGPGRGQGRKPHSDEKKSIRRVLVITKEMREMGLDTPKKVKEAGIWAAHNGYILSPPEKPDLKINDSVKIRYETHDSFKTESVRVVCEPFQHISGEWYFGVKLFGKTSFKMIPVSQVIEWKQN